MEYVAEVVSEMENGDYLVQMDNGITGDGFYISKIHPVDIHVSSSCNISKLEIGVKYKFEAYASIGHEIGCMIANSVEEVKQ